MFFRAALSCHTSEVNLPARAVCILSYCKSLQSLILPLGTLKYYPESCVIVNTDRYVKTCLMHLHCSEMNIPYFLKITFLFLICYVW